MGIVLVLKIVMHSNQNCDPIIPQFEKVTFSSGKLILHGFIHKPKGNGSFPVILMNHGSEQFPKSGQGIVEPSVNKGYGYSFSVLGEQVWGNEVFPFLANIAP
jgi:hypothetical protein